MNTFALSRSAFFMKPRLFRNACVCVCVYLCERVSARGDGRVRRNCSQMLMNSEVLYVWRKHRIFGWHTNTNAQIHRIIQRIIKATAWTSVSSMFKHPRRRLWRGRFWFKQISFGKKRWTCMNMFRNIIRNKGYREKEREEEKMETQT